MNLWNMLERSYEINVVAVRDLESLIANSDFLRFWDRWTYLILEANNPAIWRL